MEHSTGSQDASYTKIVRNSCGMNDAKPHTSQL